MANAKIGIQADTSSATKALNDVSNAVDGVSTSVNKMSKSGSLKGALRTAKKEAQELAYQLSQLSAADLKSDFGQKMAEQYRQAVAAAAELQDQMADVNQEIKNMSSDTRAWDAAKEGIQAVGSAATALVGIYSTVAGESETAAETLKTMATVQSTVNAAVTIGNALQKQSALMTGISAIQTKALAAAKTLEASATGKATIAQRVFNAVAKANPYVLLAAAVIAVGSALVAFASHSAEAKKKQEEFDAEIERGKKLADTYAEAVVSNSTDMIVKWVALREAVQKGNLSVKEQTRIFNAAKPIIEAAGGAVSNFNEAEDWIRNKHAEVINALTKRAIAMANYAVAIEMAKEKIKALAEMETSVRKAAAYIDKTLSQEEWVKLGIDPKYLKAQIQKQTAYIHDQVIEQEIVVGYTLDQNGYNKMQADLKQKTKQLSDELEKDIHDRIQSAISNENAAAAIFGDGGGTKATKTTKATKKETKDTRTELEKINDKIEEYYKKLESVNKETEEGLKQAKEYRSIIAGLKVSKLKFFDTSSLKGIIEYREYLRSIGEEFPDLFDDMQKKVTELDDSLIKMVQDMSKSTDPEALQKLKNQIEDIMKTLPQGHPLLRKFAELWKQINAEVEKNDRLVKDIQEGIQEGSIAFLKREIGELESMRDKLNPMDPDAQKEIEDITRRIERMKRQLQDAEAQQYNIRVGIEGNTDEYIKDLQDRADWWSEETTMFVNVVPKMDDANKIRAQLKRIQYDIGELLDKREYATNEMVKLSLDSKIKELNEARNKLQKQLYDTLGASGVEYLDRQIQQVTTTIARLNTFLATPGNDANTIQIYTDQLVAFQEQLLKLQREKYYLVVNTNLSEVKKEIESLSWDALKNGVGGFSAIYDSIDGLTDRLDDAKNGFESFFEVFDTIFTVVDNIMTMVESVQKIIEMIDTMTAMESAVEETRANLNASLKDNTVAALENAGAKQAQTVAETEAATAVGVNAAAEAAAAPTLQLAAKAKEQAAIAALDLATANIAAAHSEIPFAGPGLAAAGIATVTAAVAAAHSALMSLQAFAEGGIVGGTSTTGDRVLARVNSGEMILNDRQQAHLFNMINNGTSPAGAGELVGTVKVKGSDLHLALSNYDKIQKINRN